MTTSEKTLSPHLVWLMALATGLAVASNYYIQPLLHSVAQAFGIGQITAGWLVTTAQLSYATGLLLLVPLGDWLESRRLILSMMLLAGLGLLVSATAQSLSMLIVGIALTGLCSVVAQVLVPLGAALSAPDQRGKTVGTLMSGLLLGILLARTFAGLISALGSWRAVYGVAALLMFGMALLLYKNLPERRGNTELSYVQLLASVAKLFGAYPEHRLRTLLGGLCFASFSLFWTPLAFLLSAPPYGYEDALIGSFGLIGAAGALAARWAGQMADQGNGHRVTTWTLSALAVSWGVLMLGDHSLLALVIGVLLLDLAVQGCHVSNQNAVYRLQPEARNRLNSGYMTGYFMGGAVGSLASTFLYAHWGWQGVCSAGLLLGVATLGVWLTAKHRSVS